MQAQECRERAEQGGITARHDTIGRGGLNHAMEEVSINRPACFTLVLSRCESSSPVSRAMELCKRRELRRSERH